MPPGHGTPVFVFCQGHPSWNRWSKVRLLSVWGPFWVRLEGRVWVPVFWRAVTRVGSVAMVVVVGTGWAWGKLKHANGTFHLLLEYTPYTNKVRLNPFHHGF